MCIIIWHVLNIITLNVLLNVRITLNWLIYTPELRHTHTHTCTKADVTEVPVSLINVFWWSCFAAELGALLCHRLSVKTDTDRDQIHIFTKKKSKDLFFHRDAEWFMFHRTEQIPGTTECVWNWNTVLFIRKGREGGGVEKKVAILYSFDEGYNTSLSSRSCIHSFILVKVESVQSYP